MGVASSGWLSGHRTSAYLVVSLLCLQALLLNFLVREEAQNSWADKLFQNRPQYILKEQIIT
jgi:hypothetical protein